jgi:hypothetical protein
VISEETLRQTRSAAGDFPNSALARGSRARTRNSGQGQARAAPVPKEARGRGGLSRPSSPPSRRSDARGQSAAPPAHRGAPPCGPSTTPRAASGVPPAATPAIGRVQLRCPGPPRRRQLLRGVSEQIIAQADRADLLELLDLAQQRLQTQPAGTAFSSAGELDEPPTATTGSSAPTSCSSRAIASDESRDTSIRPSHISNSRGDHDLPLWAKCRHPSQIRHPSLAPAAARGLREQRNEKSRHCHAAPAESPGRCWPPRRGHEPSRSSLDALRCRVAFAA